MEQDFAITLDWQDGYRFEADFQQEGVAPLRTDEPPPLGEGSGPNPTRMLAVAVGNCMGASLKYCLDRSRVELRDLSVRVSAQLARSPGGRLRITRLRVELEPVVAEADLDRVKRCVGMFEDFCTVGQSVRQGIDIDVGVAARSELAIAEVAPT